MALMLRRAAPCLVVLMLAAAISAARADGACGPVRDPGDVEAIHASGGIDASLRDLLLPLAARRQGVAASLLELRYSIGKTATSSDAAAERRLADLRGRVEDRAAELAFLDAEISRLLRGRCS